MRLSAPKQLVFLIAVIAIIVGIVLWLMGQNTDIAFWVTAGGGVLLALANMLKGL